MVRDDRGGLVRSRSRSLSLSLFPETRRSNRENEKDYEKENDEDRSGSLRFDDVGSALAAGPGWTSRVCRRPLGGPATRADPTALRVWHLLWPIHRVGCRSLVRSLSRKRGAQTERTRKITRTRTMAERSGAIPTRRAAASTFRHSIFENENDYEKENDGGAIRLASFGDVGSALAAGPGWISRVCRRPRRSGHKGRPYTCGGAFPWLDRLP